MAGKTYRNRNEPSHFVYRIDTLHNLGENSAKWERDSKGCAVCPQRRALKLLHAGWPDGEPTRRQRDRLRGCAQRIQLINGHQARGHQGLTSRGWSAHDIVVEVIDDVRQTLHIGLPSELSELRSGKRITGGAVPREV